mmetsp:Transcript_45249/g.114840  ORF Transcript_45249/g.114840 Transcript_45249/m.114840 type:complete len:335 (-) Transcript_45249:275-1279(-)
MLGEHPLPPQAVRGLELLDRAPERVVRAHGFRDRTLRADVPVCIHATILEAPAAEARAAAGPDATQSEAILEVREGLPATWAFQGHELRDEQPLLRRLAAPGLRRGTRLQRRLHLRSNALLGNAVAISPVGAERFRRSNLRQSLAAEGGVATFACFSVAGACQRSVLHARGCPHRTSSHYVAVEAEAADEVILERRQTFDAVREGEGVHADAALPLCGLLPCVPTGFRCNGSRGGEDPFEHLHLPGAVLAAPEDRDAPAVAEQMHGLALDLDVRTLAGHQRRQVQRQRRRERRLRGAHGDGGQRHRVGRVRRRREHRRGGPAEAGGPNLRPQQR